MSTLRDSLLRNADTLRSKVALIATDSPIARGDSHVSLTWQQLLATVASLADRISRSASSDRSVPLIHEVRNSTADLLVSLACLVLGRTECPLDALAGTQYLQQCRSQVAGQFVDEAQKMDWVSQSYELAGDLPGILQRTFPIIEPDADAVILWTSGTTGGPKGVVLSHRSVSLNAKAKLAAAPQSVNDVRLTVLSIAHAYARTCDVGTWLWSGGTLAIAKGFEGWQRCSERLQPTLCNSVPSLAERIIETESGRQLRMLGCGGAAMSSKLFEKCREFGVTVIQGYGATETGPVIASQGPSESVPGRVGNFVEGWQWKFNQDRLSVRGPALMNRYWNDPEETTNRIDREGWFDTGDLVQLCERTGQLMILGRADDRIVLANGFKVDPSGVEKRLEALSGVRFAFVTAAPNARQVEAWIEGETTEAELMRVSEPLAEWERPSRVCTIQISESERAELFSRKGGIRRKPMSEFVARFR